MKSYTENTEWSLLSNCNDHIYKINKTQSCKIPRCDSVYNWGYSE